MACKAGTNLTTFDVIMGLVAKLFGFDLRLLELQFASTFCKKFGYTFRTSDAENLSGIFESIQIGLLFTCRFSKLEYFHMQIFQIGLLFTYRFPNRTIVHMHISKSNYCSHADFPPRPIQTCGQY